MMNKMCMAAVIAASLYAGTTFAQPAAVKKIIETGQTDNRVMHQLDILTNRFGGRVIGSDAYENAAEWMMREYKRWGIDVRSTLLILFLFTILPYFRRICNDLYSVI